MSTPSGPSPDPARPKREKPKPGVLESFALGPKVMGYLILAIVAGAFIYYVLLGGEPPN